MLNNLDILAALNRMGGAPNAQTQQLMLDGLGSNRVMPRLPVPVAPQPAPSLPLNRLTMQMPAQINATSAPNSTPIRQTNPDYVRQLVQEHLQEIGHIGSGFK